jgi:hypothetical protein
MSLKAFHVAFVVCSVLLAVGFGVWALLQRTGGTLYLVLGLVSFAVAAGLVVYGVWFLKKLKGVSYL